MLYTYRFMWQDKRRDSSEKSSVSFVILTDTLENLSKYARSLIDNPNFVNASCEYLCSLDSAKLCILFPISSDSIEKIFNSEV